jgi:hypothetical protein
VFSKQQIVTTGEVEHTVNQVKIMKSLKHPLLPKLYFAFQDDRALYLVVDYFEGGELFEHLIKKKRCSEAETRFERVTFKYLNKGFSLQKLFLSLFIFIAKMLFAEELNQRILLWIQMVTCILLILICQKELLLLIIRELLLGLQNILRRFRFFFVL